MLKHIGGDKKRKSPDKQQELAEKRSKMMASQSKTPITILQELAAKVVRNIVKLPKFNYD